MTGIAKALLAPVNTTGIIIVGLYTFIWGLWIANPATDVFAAAEIYSALFAVAPEALWGCVAIVCGLLIIYGAIARRYNPSVRGALVSGLHWAMIAGFYFAGNIIDPAGLTALTFSVYSAWIYLNTKVNYGKLDHHQKLP